MPKRWIKLPFEGLDEQSREDSFCFLLMRENNTGSKSGLKTGELQEYFR
jgi:hypothetical protein